MTRKGFEELLLEHTSSCRPPGCPEIRTREASSLLPLWEAAEKAAGGQVEPPFWAYSWAGGQALARYILDHPESVKEKIVLDLGCGNGLSAIAALLSGASRVLANDIDPAATWMAEINASENGLKLDCSLEDLLSSPPPVPPFEVILAGDLFYSRELAGRVEAWLRLAVRRGAKALVSDPGRAYLPQAGLTLLESHLIPVSPDIESVDQRRTSVLRVEGAA